MSARSLLSLPGFRRLFLATSLSELASNAGRMAFLLLVHELASERGGDPGRDVALVILVETAPMLLLGPIAGALVDRLDRRALLVVGDLASCALMLAIPFLARADSIAPLLGAALVFSTLGTLFHPTRQSAVPDLVPADELATANGMATASSSVALILGMSCAGVLVELTGKSGAFQLLSALFLLSAVWAAPLALPRRQRAPRNARELLGDAGRGLTYIARRPVLVFLTVSYFLCYALVGAFLALLPSFSASALDADPDHAAPLMFASFGLGGVLGGALGARLGAALGRGRLLVGAFTLLGPGTLLCSRLSSLTAAAALVAAGGALLFAVLVQDATLVQERVAPAVRGRVFAARQPMQALGYLVATGGILACTGALEPRALMGLAGALVSAGALGAALLLPGARELWRARPQSSPPPPG